MEIINTFISDDITKNDDKLSFNVQNSFEYKFDKSTDLYITGYTEPVGVVMGNVGELKNKLRTGYVLKKVGSENISVEVSLGSSTPFHVRKITVEYYIQTSSDESGGGTNDGGGFTNNGGDGTFIDVTKK